MRFRDLVRVAACAAVSTSAGCFLEPSPRPPAFDCATIDRADERFPEQCGDAGTSPDAGP